MVLQEKYIIESILATGIFYFIYMLVLRNRPMLVFNRLMLLGMVVLGLLVPLMNFSLPLNAQLPTSSVLMDEVVINLEERKTTLGLFQWHTLYFIIALFLFLQFIMQVIHLLRLGQGKRNKNQYKLISGKYPHFSFFNKIYINKDLVASDSELETVLEHEKVHVKQRHSIDILLFELLKIIFWFNPFVWLFKKLAIENHEYLADKGMLKSTLKNTHDYFTELLQNTLFTFKISLVNNFNHSLLKKRIMMMTKQNSKLIERFIPLFIVPALVMVVVFFACSESTLSIKNSEDGKLEIQTSDGEDIYQSVQVMPKFDGGDIHNFKKFIQHNLIYPKEANEKRIRGVVYVQFIVGSEGKVKDIEIVRGVDPILDAEAIRVVEISPDWTPAVHNGKNVAVQLTMPLNFMLQNEKWTTEDSQKQKAEVKKENLPDPDSGVIVVSY